MKSLGVLLCLVAVSMTAPLLDDWRVSGGERARLGQFPFAVWLNLGVTVCSGSIINADTILTAAHCVKGKSPGLITVHTGYVQRGDISQATHNVRAIFVNPKYGGGVNGDDFALLKLTKSITFDNYRKAIHLGSASDVPAPGGEALFAGYGSPNTGILFWAKLMVTKCDWGGDNPVCLTKTPSSTEAGDSGGPLFVQRGSDFYQIGVNSGAVSGGGASYTLQARVDRAVDFIRKYM